MELKFNSLNMYLYQSIVLIVPLWNWNRGDKAQPEVQDGSNRTFMELKLSLLPVATSTAAEF